ncbi:MAG: HAD family hydrolase [Agathobacter sp.]|nr:HAD family hydrolase [Agathobacter sp.]
MKDTQTILKEAVLPEQYTTYVFDLYGTLVDIHTEEDDPVLWQKLALFYGYYDAIYDPEELKEAYGALVKGKEAELKQTLDGDARYSHEASPEIEITEVFRELYARKGVEADEALAVHTGQFFRVLSTEYVRTYPGTETMLRGLRENGKKVYLLSNAQRIFTEYEMHVLGIAKYFDGILISSDYKTKKPDKRFFDILMEQYELIPEKTLFIGNDSHTDIAGAQTVGLDTFYVHSNISPAKDLAENATYAVNNFFSW